MGDFPLWSGRLFILLGRPRKFSYGLVLYNLRFILSYLQSTNFPGWGNVRGKVFIKRFSCKPVALQHPKSPKQSGKHFLSHSEFSSFYSYIPLDYKAIKGNAEHSRRAHACPCVPTRTIFLVTSSFAAISSSNFTPRIYRSPSSCLMSFFWYLLRVDQGNKF